MQKFEHFRSNLAVLSRAGQQDLENEFIISGIIDKFMLQFELGWKVMKELLRFEGRAEARSGSPREILKTAFQLYDFMDEDIWVAMLNDRNSITHEYNENAALELARRIIDVYIPVFQLTQSKIIEQYPELCPNE